MTNFRKGVFCGVCACCHGVNSVVVSFLEEDFEELVYRTKWMYRLKTHAVRTRIP